MEEPPSSVTVEDLVRGWEAVGVRPGMVLMVHASLSALGRVDGGAEAVVAALRTAIGPSGTLVMPAFTPDVADPTAPTDRSEPPDAAAQAGRDAVKTFSSDMPSSMGAISEALREQPGTVRSGHPQVSVIANGPAAGDIVAHQTFGFAVGRDSPFGVVHDLDGYILLIGVGHNRNTFLHHAETLAPNRRLKLRRFPMQRDGERLWIETLDVADDLGKYFPAVGLDFEARTGTDVVTVGSAACRLLRVRPFVAFSTERLTALLGEGAE